MLARRFLVWDQSQSLALVSAPAIGVEPTNSLTPVVIESATAIYDVDGQQWLKRPDLDSPIQDNPLQYLNLSDIPTVDPGAKTYLAKFYSNSSGFVVGTVQSRNSPVKTAFVLEDHKGKFAVVIKEHVFGDANTNLSTAVIAGAKTAFKIGKDWVAMRAPYGPPVTLDAYLASRGQLLENLVTAIPIEAGVSTNIVAYHEEKTGFYVGNLVSKIQERPALYYILSAGAPGLRAWLIPSSPELALSKLKELLTLSHMDSGQLLEGYNGRLVGRLLDRRLGDGATVAYSPATGLNLFLDQALKYLRRSYGDATEARYDRRNVGYIIRDTEGTSEFAHTLAELDSKKSISSILPVREDHLLVAMTWFKTRPTVAGYYWLKIHAECRIVELCDFKGEKLYISSTTANGRPALREDMQLDSPLLDDALWCGPLKSPD
jgi:hypothetical protein